MSAMLERVARVCWSKGQQVSDSDYCWDSLHPDNREHWLSVARAALMAMREPSDEVAREVGRAAWHSGSGQRPANVWIAGVEAILNEPPCPDAPGGVASSDG